MLFLGFQRAEPFGGCGVEKKSGERLPFGEAFIRPALFGTEETRGRGNMPSHNRSLFADFCKKHGQTSIVLELGYKFWGAQRALFFREIVDFSDSVTFLYLCNQKIKAR